MHKLSQEIQEVVGLQSDTVLTYDIINHMTYLDHVVKEVLRVAPPAGGGFRRVIKTFELDVSVLTRIKQIHTSVCNTNLFLSTKICQ